MPRYHYRALTPSGSIEQGQLEAPNSHRVRHDLRRRGYTPMQVENLTDDPLDTPTRRETHTEAALRLKPPHILSFTSQLYDLLEGGLALEPALESMATRKSEPLLTQLSQELQKKITHGVSLRQALATTSPDFDELYLNLVAAGESSGSLITILGLHSQYLEKRRALRQQIQQALIYPTLLVLACLGACAVFLFYLVPHITEMLSTLPNAKTPWLISVSQKTSQFLLTHPLQFLMIFLPLLIGFGLLTHPRFKPQLDALKLRLPVLRSITRHAFYLQWLQTMENLLANGEPLLRSLELTNRTIGNQHLRHPLRQATQKIEGGKSLSAALRSENLFPPVLVDLLQVGERTGNQITAFRRARDHYQKAFDRLLSRMITLIPFFILLFLTLLVGTLSYTMIQSIYETTSTLQRS